MNSWTPTTSKTKNWAAYNRALKQRGSLSIWFDTEMDWDATPSGNRGRQQVDSDAGNPPIFNMLLLNVIEN